jgi:hypothetical protein
MDRTKIQPRLPTECTTASADPAISLASKSKPIAIPKIEPIQNLLNFGIEKDLVRLQTRKAKRE